ncbi:MAG: hypothetical protein M3Y28_04680 [Armatimonadota bacterium]|nr:hypothetical protein [Armatimonadota bacterium]
MTDDDFEDILDQIHHLYPERSDRFVQPEYDKAVAAIVNTGGEEQRARLEELLEALAEENDPNRQNTEDDDEDGQNGGTPWSLMDARR